MINASSFPFEHWSPHVNMQVLPENEYPVGVFVSPTSGEAPAVASPSLNTPTRSSPAEGLQVVSRTSRSSRFLAEARWRRG
jgi:hypothetical protein